MVFNFAVSFSSRREKFRAYTPLDCTMKIIILVVLPLLFISNAYAQCTGGKTIFSCTTTKGKQIEVCDMGKTINYSFGKKQAKPEIVVQAPRETASTYQWSGVGRTMSYAVDIPNGKTSYSIFWGVDRMTEAHSIEAGVNVLNNGNLVATVNCVEKGIINNLEGVDLKPTE